MCYFLAHLIVILRDGFCCCPVVRSCLLGLFTLFLLLFRAGMLGLYQLQLVRMGCTKNPCRNPHCSPAGGWSVSLSELVSYSILRRQTCPSLRFSVLLCVWAFFARWVPPGSSSQICSQYWQYGTSGSLHNSHNFGGVKACTTQAWLPNI